MKTRSDKIEIDKLTLKVAYNQHGSLNKVAKELGVSAKTIKSRMSELGLEYSPRVHYECDEDFFAPERRSRLQYYWAGFLAADGGVDSRKNSYTLKLELSSKDREHLLCFKQDIKSTAPINDYENFVNVVSKKYYKSVIRVGSKKLCTDMLRFNITPRKTYSYKIPVFIENDDFVNSFILGMIDGDGWVRINDGTVCVGVCGTENVVKTIKKVLKNNLNIKGSLCKGGNIFKFEVGGNDQASKLYDWLYCGNKRFLQRKHDVMIQAKSLIIRKKLDLEKDDLEYLYGKYGSVGAVAEHLGYEVSSVIRYFKKYGLDYNNRSYDKNENFFSINNESEEQFYWAGYLSGKCSLSIKEGRYNITFVDKDQGIVDSFKAVIESSSTSERLSINSEVMFRDLNRFGIMPGKANSSHIPDWLKKHELVRHFVRGRMKAKSSYSKSQNLIEFTGAERFLWDLKEVFEGAGIETKSIPRKKSNKNSTRMNYSGANVDKIYNWVNKQA